MDPNTRAEVEKAVSDLKRAMDGDDVAEIKGLTETLSQASHAMAQVMYQQDGPSTAHKSGHDYQQASSADSEEVVDAEYEEVK